MFAVSLSQLQSSVKAYYGLEYNATRLRPDADMRIDFLLGPQETYDEKRQIICSGGEENSTKL